MKQAQVKALLPVRAAPVRARVLGAVVFILGQHRAGPYDGQCGGEAYDNRLSDRRSKHAGPPALPLALEY